VGIYKRISKEQLQPDKDHTSKLIAVDNSIAGLNKPVFTYLLHISFIAVGFIATQCCA